MERHDPDPANAYGALIYREDLNTSPLDNRLASSQAQELLTTAGAVKSLATDSGYEDDNIDNHSVHSELLERRTSTISRDGDREPVMHRSFSPLAGLALGFRYISLVAEEETLLMTQPPWTASQIHGLDI